MSDAPNTSRKENPYLNKKDDMYDDDHDLGRGGKLAKALSLWSNITDSYWNENHRALKQQKWHRRIAIFAVWTGTIAVILAVVQLLFYDQPIWQSSIGDWIGRNAKSIAIGEFLAAMLAAIAVFLGLVLGMQKKWLLKRHKTERMRMLKYRSLLEYAAKGMSDKSLQELEAGSREGLHRIAEVEEPKLKEWISVNQTWGSLEPVENCLTHEQMAEFLEYYRRKRLDSQAEYFNEGAEKAEHRGSITGLLPPLFFLASILCVSVHYGYEVFEERHASHDGRAQVSMKADAATNEGGQTAPPGKIALILIAGAASFPLLGSAIRTYRSAYEFSRNSKRFRATYTDLHQIGGRVHDKRKKPELVLKELWEAEDSLEREHREWLRLMIEAEWFG